MNVTSEILIQKFENKLITLDEIQTQANIYLSENKFETAYPYVKAASIISIDSQTDKITAALLAVTLEKTDEAKALFQLVIDKDSLHFDANYNLALIEIDEKNYSSAYNRLLKLSEQHKTNTELQNDLAVTATFQDDNETAFSHWTNALEINPHDSNARNNALAYSLERNFYKEADQLLTSNLKQANNNQKSVAEINRWKEILIQKTESEYIESHVETLKDKKIVIFSSISSFIDDIKQHLALANEVKTFSGTDVNEMLRLMEWADISWFEWCDQYLIEATKHEKKSKIVCRLHSYEAFTNNPSEVDWSKVDLLIFVNKSVQELVSNRIPQSVKQIVIHNAVDLDKFQIPQNKKYGKKIASVGYINYKKNPELLLYCFKKLYDYDNSYSLHIAGQHQDPRIQLYFEHFIQENNLPIHFDGWVKDMAAWYRDKDFVISTSLFESFHYSIAEGMASGLIPLIHNWYGAKYLYPQKYLFNTPDQLFEQMKQYKSEDLYSLALENRNFIQQKYNLSDQLQKISNHLIELTHQQQFEETY